MVSISIAAEYGYVIIVTALVTLQCTLVGFASAGPRYKAFSKEFIQQHLSAEDEATKKLYGKGIDKGCHPDNGLGRFGDKLPLEAWYAVANAQRTHQNYLEQLPQIITLLLLAGIFLPRFTAAVGVLYLIGRFLFTSGYKSKGPSGRGLGFGLSYLAHLLLLIVVIYGGLQLTALPFVPKLF